MLLLLLILLLATDVRSRTISLAQTSHNKTIISTYYDYLSHRAKNSGLYTDAEIESMRNNAIQFLSIGYGIYLNGIIPDTASGIVRLRDIWMYPYAMTYTPKEDDEHSEKVGSWRVEEYGFMVTMMTRGTFPSGMNKDKKYNAGDMIFFTEYNYLSPKWNNDDPLNPDTREIILSMSNTVSLMVWNHTFQSYDIHLESTVTDVLGMYKVGTMKGLASHITKDDILFTSTINL